MRTLKTLIRLGWCSGSLDLYLEILLDFQVQLTMILANGTFPLSEWLGKFAAKMKYPFFVRIFLYRFLHLVPGARKITV